MYIIGIHKHTVLLWTATYLHNYIATAYGNESTIVLNPLHHDIVCTTYVHFYVVGNGLKTKFL